MKLWFVVPLVVTFLGCGDSPKKSTPDTDAPTVQFTVPADSTTGVSVNHGVTVTFSEPINAASIQNGGFVLMAGDTSIGGQVTVGGSAAVFTPSDVLAPYTEHTATVSGVADLAGNALAEPYTWTFTTSAAPDEDAPTLAARAPTGVRVPVDATVTAVFSENVDPATLTATSFRLEDGADAVAGTITVDGNVASIAPSSDLVGEATYTVTITTAVKDLAGHPLAEDVSWSFTTQAGTLEVRAVTPAADSVDVALDTSIVLLFSTPLDPATVTASTVYLADAAPVSASLDVQGNVVTLQPTAQLDASTSYTIHVVENGVADFDGNALTTAFTSSFVTHDLDGPLIDELFPADGAADLSTDLVVYALFSEAIDPLSVADQFTLVDDQSTAVTGTVSVVGSTLSFTPDAALSPGITYTATIGTGTTDLFGNPVAAERSWTFTTHVGALKVLAVTPGDGAADVTYDGTVTLVFSNRLDPATVTASTVYLEDSAPIGAGLSVQGNVITIEPDAALLSSTLYTVHVTKDGVTDHNGNALTTAFTSSFTTSVIDCTTEQAAACDTDASCTVVGGMPQCTCNEGFTGNGMVCSNQNECALQLDDCDPNASCQDGNGSYTCTCNEYYQGDGRFCYLMDPNVDVADVSHDPVRVEIIGIGFFSVGGLGQIASEVAFNTSPVANGRVAHSVYDVYVHDVVLRDITGDSAIEDDALSAWIASGGAKDVDIHLHGPNGESLVARLAGSTIASSTAGNTLCTDDCQWFNDGECDDGLSGSSFDVCDPGTDCTDCGPRANGMDELVLSVTYLGHTYTPPTQQPVPSSSIVIEVDGISTDAGFLPDDFDDTPAGATDPIVLRKIPNEGVGSTNGADDYLKWPEIARGEFDNFGTIYDRRGVHQLFLDDTGTEIRRVSCYNAIPAKTYYFNPTKTHGASFLVDVEIAVEYCVDS